MPADTNIWTSLKATPVRFIAGLTKSRLGFFERTSNVSVRSESPLLPHGRLGGGYRERGGSGVSCSLWRTQETTGRQTGFLSANTLLSCKGHADTDVAGQPDSVAHALTSYIEASKSILRAPSNITHDSNALWLSNPDESVDCMHVQDLPKGYALNG